MSASAPAARRFFGPVAEIAIGTSASSAQRIRTSVPWHVDAVRRPSGLGAAERLAQSSRRHGLQCPSSRTALSPRPMPEDDAARDGAPRASRYALAVTVRWRVKGFVTAVPTTIRSVRARRAGQVDVDVLPEDLRVDEPGVLVADASAASTESHAGREVLRAETARRASSAHAASCAYGRERRAARRASARACSPGPSRRRSSRSPARAGAAASSRCTPRRRSA